MPRVGLLSPSIFLFFSFLFFSLLFFSFLFFSLLFFFNDTATPEIYTLSLHDALPIWPHRSKSPGSPDQDPRYPGRHLRQGRQPRRDRKSTRLNSSHANISHAVFC